MVLGDDFAGPDEKEEEEDSPQLLRTRSDASFMHIQRRTKTHSARDLQRLRTHRFSINGHFYNHKVPRTQRTMMWSTVDATSGTVRHTFLPDMRSVVTFAVRLLRGDSGPCVFSLKQGFIWFLLNSVFVVVGSEGLPAAGISSQPELPGRSVQGVQEQVLMQKKSRARRLCPVSKRYPHVFLSSTPCSVYYGPIVQYNTIKEARTWSFYTSSFFWTCNGFKLRQES